VWPAPGATACRNCGCQRDQYVVEAFAGGTGRHSTPVHELKRKKSRSLKARLGDRVLRRIAKVQYVTLLLTFFAFFPDMTVPHSYTLMTRCQGSRNQFPSVSEIKTGLPRSSEATPMSSSCAYALNPDISGIGVRISYYLQTLFLGAVNRIACFHYIIDTACRLAVCAFGVAR
jgi:hypothetical protein